MRRFTIAALFCMLLAIVHTWPLTAAPHRHSLNYNADAELTAWIVSWIAYTLPHEPQRLFAGNIFQPDARVLAYSEPLFVPALMGAPIRWFGGSAVLTNNILLIVGLWLTALAGWWVVQRWTGSFAGGLVAGALLAFNSHLLSRLPHLQAAHAWGLPLALYATERLTADSDQSSWIGRAAALALVVAAVATTSVYSLMFAVVIITVEAMYSVRSWSALGRLSAAGVLALLMALPFLWPYVQLASEGTRRPLEQAAQLSAAPSGYLVSLSRLDAPWSRRFFTRDINVFFPGLVALALAAAGVVFGVRDSRKRVAVLITIAIAGLVLSLGPATIVYRVAYLWCCPCRVCGCPRVSDSCHSSPSRCWRESGSLRSNDACVTHRGERRSASSASSPSPPSPGTEPCRRCRSRACPRSTSDWTPNHSRRFWPRRRSGPPTQCS